MIFTPEQVARYREAFACDTAHAYLIGSIGELTKQVYIYGDDGVVERIAEMVRLYDERVR